MNKVLLVEDSLVETEKLTSLLEKKGFSVLGVRSGEEAQLILKRQKPNLILLDVILPGLSGFELCRKLKANPETQTIPIVICSTKNKEVDKTWGKMSGADAYLTKPVDETTLLQTVNEFIK
ncbi:response regulator receiver, CheY [Stanieria sp. NIES-3757]|uniref:Response regulator receiver protein n=1 Tax=Stanieria cyanosphaera (strain ATCC 29371 / PCC 7437) TaxID=111780 RepID=K9Y0T5_STAC7|nr:response regulator [Stanieria cyanosphaera]AFZ37547.1 response regulator receiver protein [Stanieria cyanosphaera PCC 7437]BAU67052.1 response regulator receiver, CheY [Stanieria sp. NIES-3757]